MVYIKENARHLWYSHPGIRIFLKAIICPFCCLCWCCGAMFNRRCIPKSQRRERERVSELSLINQKRRERAIKDRKRSPSVDRTKRGRTRQQDKSPLFKKLPLELRLKIYEAALGESGPINVGFAEERYDQMALTSTACLEPENAGMPFCSCKPKNKQHRLKLLLTCKRIYREAIDVLYSSNTFAFSHPETFMLFKKTVLPKRLNQIRDISIENISGDCGFENFRRDFHFYHSRPEDVVDALLSLSRLKKVIFTSHFRKPVKNSAYLSMTQIESLVGLRWTKKSCRVFHYAQLVQGELDREMATLDAGTGKLYGRYPLGEVTELLPSN